MHIKHVIMFNQYESTTNACMDVCHVARMLCKTIPYAAGFATCLATAWLLFVMYTVGKLFLSLLHALQDEILDDAAAILKPVFNATVGEYRVACLFSGTSKASDARVALPWQSVWIAATLLNAAHA